MLVATSNENLLKKLVDGVGNEFELKDFGEVKNYLGIQLFRDSKGNFPLLQSNYIDQIAEVAGFNDAKISKMAIDTGY